jgi:hypothetical protein
MEATVATGTIYKIAVFKTARSGSTWMSSVMASLASGKVKTNELKHKSEIKHKSETFNSNGIVVNWEPLTPKGKEGACLNLEHSMQEYFLHQLLTKVCMYQKDNKCMPQKWRCEECDDQPPSSSLVNGPERSQCPLRIISLNPRFVNLVSWNTVFGGLDRNKLRIINLRRTNLV